MVVAGAGRCGACKGGAKEVMCRHGQAWWQRGMGLDGEEGQKNAAQQSSKNGGRKEEVEVEQKRNV